MKKTFDSLAIDTTNIALNIMTTEELRAIINRAANKIDEKAEQHRIAIEQAIADAIDDGFDVSFWVEGKNDGCFIDHEETDRITHVTVN